MSELIREARCPTLRFLKGGSHGRAPLGTSPMTPYCPGISRELPETAEARAEVQGSFDCACGFIRRIRMLRSG
jgi:hypothetical protein